MRHAPVVKCGIQRTVKMVRARVLRREMTGAERLLWQRLRADQIGFHFRRQQVIEGFIVDFVCLEARVVVEVDGAVHDQQIEEDAHRDEVLSSHGFAVIRFLNESVDDHLDAVVDRITSECERRAQRDS